MINGFLLPFPNNWPKIKNPSLKGEAVNTPFLKFIPKDNEEFTVNGFIDAVKRDCLEDALVYISKNYLDRVDIDLIRNELLYQTRSPFVVDANFSDEPKNCRKNTLLIKDSDRIKLFHIYMLSEPDSYGKWKIYGIEQE